MNRSTLLELDGVGNVLLGIPLILFPSTVSRFLGLPPPNTTLYPVVLGSIFCGIGIALLVERFKPSWSGLGLGGAMSINALFGLVLVAWLVFGQTALLVRGAIVLWGLAVILIVISAAELIVIRFQADNQPFQPDELSRHR